MVCGTRSHRSEIGLLQRRACPHLELFARHRCGGQQRRPPPRGISGVGVAASGDQLARFGDGDAGLAARQHDEQHPLLFEEVLDRGGSEVGDVPLLQARNEDPVELLTLASVGVQQMHAGGDGLVGVNAQVPADR